MSAGGGRLYILMIQAKNRTAIFPGGPHGQRHARQRHPRDNHRQHAIKRAQRIAAFKAVRVQGQGQLAARAHAAQRVFDGGGENFPPVIGKGVWRALRLACHKRYILSDLLALDDEQQQAIFLLRRPRAVGQRQAGEQRIRPAFRHGKGYALPSRLPPQGKQLRFFHFHHALKENLGGIGVFRAEHPAHAQIPEVIFMHPGGIIREPGKGVEKLPIVIMILGQIEGQILAVRLHFQANILHNGELPLEIIGGHDGAAAIHASLAFFQFPGGKRHQRRAQRKADNQHHHQIGSRVLPEQFSGASLLHRRKTPVLFRMNCSA